MMKILIIEDEEGIRNNMRTAYDWEQMGCEICGIVANALEAVEICLTQPPDLIISDIVMPGIDGITFLKYIKERNPDIHFIIMTGHREFEYAKNAVNFGADAFMLKPIHYQELSQIILKISTILRNQNDEEKKQYEKEIILRKLLEGRLNNEMHSDSFVHAMLGKYQNPYCIAVLEPDGEAPRTPQYIQGLLSACIDLNIEDNCCFLKMNYDHFVDFIYFSHKVIEWKTSIYNYFIALQQRIYDLFKITVSIGVSELLSGQQSMQEGYLQAKKSLSNRFFSGFNSIHFFASGGEDSFLDYYQILDTQQLFYDLLQNSSGIYLTEKAGNLLDQTIQTLGKNRAFIKSSILILATLCSKHIFNENKRQLASFMERHANFQAIVSSENIDNLKGVFLSILLDLSEYISVKKQTDKQIIIDRIVQYIEENYASNISLNDVAKVVFLSPGYLSALIPSITGNNFTEILTQTRIKHSIDLMKQNQLKNSVIARKVGFSQPQYFSHAFKKVTGYTPTEYRQTYL
ncbi:MAG: response regulator [Clostridiales bacterium]|nr:response regulator [Clostridiales bacterium]